MALFALCAPFLLTLRNADRRGPFMHDGSEKTLEDVIELYDLGAEF